LCGKTIPRGKERLIVEKDDPPRKIRVEVCGRCVAGAVLETLARRVADNLPKGDNDTRAEAARIRTLTRELSTLLAQEAPRPAVKFLTAADIPAWVAEGLREAIRRKCAEKSQAAH
jgi:hypothetical protein